MDAKARVAGAAAWLDRPTAIVIGSMLSLLSGAVLSFYFGVLWGGAWAVATLIAENTARLLRKKAFSDRRRYIRAAHVSGFTSLSLWMAYAFALWFQGEPAARMLALSSLFSLCVHVLFVTRTDRRNQIIYLTPPALTLVVFVWWVCLETFPLLLGVPLLLSGVGTIFSISLAAAVTNKTFMRLQNALNASHENKKRLAFAVESAGDGSFEIDVVANMIKPSDAVCRQLGYATGPVGVTRMFDLFHPDDQRAGMEDFGKLVRGEIEEWNQELRVRAHSGSYFWMLHRARVLSWKEDGTAKIIMGTLIDTSRWKRLEAELRAAKEYAELSNRSKSEFLANMSHEIRTPLNGVLGMAQSLENDQLPPAQREKVAVILDSGNTLMALLNDVLDLSKIEAGKLEISCADLDLVKAVGRMRRLFLPQAEEKGLRIEFNCAPDFPHWLHYDPVRIRQCVSNLVSNAIKFTESGTVTIDLSAEEQDGVYLISVAVSDTGIGMSPETVGRLFSVFTQADGTTSRRFGGTGLGLAIARQLARLMGGDVTAASEEGKGFEFTFTFRAAPALPREETQEALAGNALGSGGRDDRLLPHARILLADDNNVNRQVIRMLLGPLGLTIVEAANGREALEKLAAEPFDLVLLDIHMPVMDGRETIAAIRACTQAWSTIPVIALTADAMSGDREKYLALGMDDYLSKPVDQRELHAKMFAFLAMGDRSSVPGGPAVPTSATAAGAISQDELDDLFGRMDEALAS